MVRRYSRSRSRSFSRRRNDSRRRSPPRRGGRGSRRYDSRERGGKQSGIVVAWHLEKGFGFIKPHRGGEDVFAHVSGLRDGDALREGDEVRFEENWDASRRKYRAEEVTGCCRERDVRPRDGYRSRSRGRGRDDDRRGGP